MTYDKYLLYIILSVGMCGKISRRPVPVATFKGIPSSNANEPAGPPIKFLFLAVFISILAFSQNAQAQIRNWINPTSGNWNTLANWDTGVPVSTATANIANGGTALFTTGTGGYRLLNLGSTLAGFLTVSGGTLSGTTTIVGSVNSGRLTLSGGNMTTSSIAITPAASFTGSVILNGGLLSTNSITANSLPGAVLTLNGGTLQASSSNLTFISGFSPNSIILGASGGRINSGTFSVGIDSDITGSGGLIKLGAGTLILTKNNTYTGITTISSGTLQIGNGAGTGSIVGNVINSGALSFNNSNNIIYSGTITGVGSMTKNNGGTLTFTGNNGYIGGTTINSGIIQIGNGGTTGNIIRNIINNSSIVFNRSDNIVYSGTISGPGTLTQNGTGALILTGNNTYTGITTINSGTLQIGNAGSTGFVVSNIVNNSVLKFNKNNTNIFTGTITGTGMLIMSGSTSVVALSGENSYTGGTIIEGGALVIGAAGFTGTGTTGSIVGDVLMTSTTAFLSFSRSDSIVFSGTVTGTGSVFQGGPGAVTLTAPKAYLGTTIAFTGTLIGDTSALQGDLFTNTDASLVFTQVGKAILSGTISGPGNVVINSPGGGVSFNTDQIYTGLTTIQAGELSVNAQLSSPTVLINPNGILSGSGNLLGNVTNSGLLSPGTSSGTITIHGNYTQNSTGALLIEIASNSSFDRIVVGGGAQLDGALQVSLLGGFVPVNGNSFTILSATAGVTGTFKGLNFPPGFPFQVIYDPNDVRLVFIVSSPVIQEAVLSSAGLALLGTVSAVTPQEAIPQEVTPQESISEKIIPKLGGGIKDILFNITNTQYGQITTRLAGIRSGVGKVTLQGLTREPMVEQFSKREARWYDGKCSVVDGAKPSLWDIFASASGVFSNLNSISDLPNAHSIAGLFSVGADCRINEYFNVGIYTGYEGLKSWFADGSWLRSNGVRFGLYGTAQWNGFYINGIVGGGAHFLKLNRSIDVLGSYWTARSNPFAGELDSLLGGGYEYRWGSWIFGANTSIQYTYLGISSFQESGANNLNVRVSSQNPSSLVYTLGGNISYLWEMAPNYRILPTMGLSWQHEFLNYGQRIDAIFANGLGVPFYFQSSTAARNNAFGVAGITAQIGTRLGAYAYYNPQFGGYQIVSHGVLIGLNYIF